jgi:hypothetical protein
LPFSLPETTTTVSPRLILKAIYNTSGASEIILV